MEAAACFDLVWGMLEENYRIKNMMKRKFSTCERCFSQKKNIAESLCSHHTVDGSEILLTSWYVVYPIIYGVLYIPGGWEWDFFHQQYFDSRIPTLWTLQASSCCHWEAIFGAESPACKPISNLQGLQSRRGGCYIPPIKSRKSKNLLLKKIMVPRRLSVFGIYSQFYFKSCLF